MRIIPEGITGKEPCIACERKDNYCERHPCHYVDGMMSLIDGTIVITDVKYRPDNWPEFVKYFEDRPKHWPLTDREMWEFGATSMLNALISLTGEGK